MGQTMGQAVADQRSCPELPTPWFPAQLCLLSLWCRSHGLMDDGISVSRF